MGLACTDSANYVFRAFDGRDAMVDAACLKISQAIQKAVSARGLANLALSGGSTPRPVYAALAAKDLPWEYVRATLVDERITDEKSGSNRVMIETSLLQHHGAKMVLEPLDQVQNNLSQFDVALMGMGTDGHTASWFPGSKNIKDVMDPNTQDDVQIINAADCSGAGDYAERITLSLPAVMNSRQILLLLTGEEKRRAFERAKGKSVYDAPVKALLAAGPRLTAMWAP